MSWPGLVGAPACFALIHAALQCVNTTGPDVAELNPLPNRARPFFLLPHGGPGRLDRGYALFALLLEGAFISRTAKQPQGQEQ